MNSLRLPEQNSVILTGRLTRDAETRYTAKGQPVCNFDIAVNRRYKDTATNEWKDDVSFVTIVSWGPAAERCNERGKKGTAVHVTGRLKSRSWETKDGQKRSSLDVVSTRVQFLTKAQDVADTSSEGTGSASAAAVEETEEVPF